MVTRYGMRTLSGALTRQLGSNIRNPVLKVKSAANTVAHAYAVEAASKLEISYTRASANNVPVCAVRPTGTQELMLAWTVDSGLTRTWIFLTNLAPGTAVSYYIFDEVPAAALPYGVRLKDAAGNIVFGIQDKPLKTRAIIKGTMAGQVGTNSVAYDAGKDYAVSPGKWITRTRRVIQNDSGNIDGQSFTCVSGGVDLKMLRLYTQIDVGSVLADDNTFATRELMVVDVTGL